MSMKKDTFGRDVALAFSRPFSGKGLMALLLSFIFNLIPLLSFISRGVTYSFSAGGSRRFGSCVGLGLKIFVTRLLLAAPALLVYAAATLINSYFASLPMAIYIALMFLFVLFSVRTVMLMPLAACCLALGAPVRYAVNGRALRAILSGSMGRFILSAVICGIMLFLCGAASLFGTVLTYVLGAAFAALYNMFASGLFMGCCRHALGIEPPARTGARSPARRAVAALLVPLLLVCALAPQASAAGKYDDDVRPVRPSDGAAGLGDAPEDPPKSFLEAYQRFSERGLLTKGRSVQFNDSDGTYYVGSDSFERGAKELFELGLDAGTDLLPVVGNVKSAVQAGYYSYKYATTDDPLEKQRCGALAAYKGAGVLLSSVGGVIKGAKLVNGGALFKFASAAAKYENVANAAETAGNVMSYYDWVNNGISAYNIISGDTSGEWLAPENLALALEYAAEHAFDDPFATYKTPQNIWTEYADPYPRADLPEAVPIGTAGGTVILDGPVPTVTPYEGPVIGPAKPTPYDGPVIGPVDGPVGTPEPSQAPGVFGRFSGAQIAPSIAEVLGVNSSFTPNTVYVTIDSDGTAVFQTTVASTYKFELYGVTMNGGARATVRYEDIVPEDTGRGTLDYSFKTRVSTESWADYSGEYYENGGGTASTYYDTDYTVTFSLTINDKLEPKITGQMICETVLDPSYGDAVSPSVTIDFVLTPMD